jgi:hypothetical protein
LAQPSAVDIERAQARVAQRSQGAPRVLRKRSANDTLAAPIVVC